MFAPRSLCTLAIAAVALVAPAQFATAQTAPKIALINPAKVFNDMQETKDLKQAMQGQTQNIQNQAKQLEEELKELQKRVTMFNEGSDDHTKANEAMMNKAVQYRVWQEMMKANLQRQQKAQMINLFKKIETATTDVAKAKGLNLVVVEQKVDLPTDAATVDQINVDQLRGLINQRTVMYSDGSMDITDEVTKKVDETYKKK